MSPTVASRLVRELFDKKLDACICVRASYMYINKINRIYIDNRKSYVSNFRVMLCSRVSFGSIDVRIAMPYNVVSDWTKPM